VQHQQRADAVGVRDALSRQSLQLAVQPARVFVLGRGLVQHRPHAGFARVITQQHRQQLVAIEPVGLGSPGASVDLDAGRVDHDAVDALPDQPAMQPPAISSCLVAGVHLHLCSELAALLGLAQAVNNRGRVAGIYRVSARAVAPIAGGQFPLLVAQLEAYVQGALNRRILAS
jgi:hypothetical protein